MTALEKFVFCIIEEAEKAPPNTSIADLMGSMGWVNKQVEPVVEPVALTVAEIEQMNAQWNYEIHGDRTRYLVRMTEKAHGIGEKE